MGIIDPLKIEEKDLPLIVLVDDRRSFLGFLIKSHSHGNYNHIMEMHDFSLVASQDMVGYRERSIEDYMKPHFHLKFWKINMTPDEIRRWKNKIQQELDAPWMRRRYDWLGILGQFLHLKWLNNNSIKYCSEMVASHLNLITGLKFPEHPTPSDLNNAFKLIDRMEVYGYWFID